MKNNFRYRSLRILMVFSLMLLTGFAVYWLYNQYKEEKILLTEDLQREFQQAGEEVLDSLLLSVYIMPALKDSLKIMFEFSDSVNNNNNTFSNVSTVRQHIITKDTSGLNSGQNIEIIQAEIDSNAAENEFIRRNSDMLVRSFKLIVSSTSEDSLLENMEIISLEGGEKEQMLKDNFESRLVGKSYFFMVEWKEDEVLQKVIQPDRIILSKISFFPEETVIISGVLFYLLRQIAPQILFVFFLVGLTFIAFIQIFRAMKNQLELNRLRKDMVSNMTHELKTPVSTMKVALEAIDVFEAGKDPEVAKEYMDIATSEINKLDQLIARLLDQVSLEEKEKTLRTQKFDLLSLVNDCITNFRPRLEKKGAEIVFRPDSDSILMEGDPWYIRAALNNLLDNALKYGGEKPHVEVLATINKDQNIAIEVRDNGPGVPEKYSRKIFDKFFRIPTGDVHDHKGHGLGLSMAALVMKLHRGKIRQENRKEGGSAFIMEFYSY